jgi:hypothetical protein
MSATFAVIIGSLLSHWYDRRTRHDAQPGARAAAGDARRLGADRPREHLGVIAAGVIVLFAKDAPIALVPESFALAPWLGVIGFVGVIVWLYRWMLQRSAVAAPQRRA